MSSRGTNRGPVAFLVVATINAVLNIVHEAVKGPASVVSVCLNSSNRPVRDSLNARANIVAICPVHRIPRSKDATRTSRYIKFVGIGIGRGGISSGIVSGLDPRPNPLTKVSEKA